MLQWWEHRYFYKREDKTMYMSLTMGNIVDTKREIIAQIIESLFKFHTIDIRWEKITHNLEGKPLK